MAKITPNMSEAVDMTPLTPGKYKARITGEKVNPTKKDPNAYYCRWELTIFGAEGAAEKANGRKVFHNTMLSGPGSGMFRTFFMAVNKIEKPEDVPQQLECDTEEFLGKEVEVTVADQLGQDGQPNGYSEVKGVAPVAA